MAHSFKFIYWKVCCYLCVRPKKKRKRTPNRSFTVPYRQTMVRSPTTTNVQRGVPCNSNPITESPHLASSSSYHTAQCSSSPTISSSASTPQHESNQAQICPPMTSSPKISSKLHLASTNYSFHNSNYDKHMQEIPLAPVITNKYALQEDLSADLQSLQIHKRDGPALTMTPSVFAIMNPKGCNNYQYSSHQAYRTSDGFQWNGNNPYMDTDLDITDEESLRDLTPEPEDEEEVSVPMWLCLALVISYICGGAVLFTFWEKWNFLDSSYFCFVTLTTIGFGDLVPGTAVISDDNQLTLGLCSLYLLFGMALLAMSFNLVQEEVTRSMKCVGKRIGIISDDEDD